MNERNSRSKSREWSRSRSRSSSANRRAQAYSDHFKGNPNKPINHVFEEKPSAISVRPADSGSSSRIHGRDAEWEKYDFRLKIP